MEHMNILSSQLKELLGIDSEIQHHLTFTLQLCRDQTFLCINFTVTQII